MGHGSIETFGIPDLISGYKWITTKPPFDSSSDRTGSWTHATGTILCMASPHDSLPYILQVVFMEMLNHLTVTLIFTTSNPASTFGLSRWINYMDASPSVRLWDYQYVSSN